MKKFFFLFLLCTPLISSNAQYIRHDITVSYGIVTADQISDLLKDVLTTIFTFGTYEKDNYDYSGALFVTYKNAVNYRWHVGATLGMDNVSGDLFSNGNYNGTFSTKHRTLAAEADLRWVKRDHFQLYSGLGLGYTFTSEKGETTTGESENLRSGHSAVQVNALGIRAGNRLGALLEFGFGYKGILNFGLSYRFE
jgi:hypothetical protein